MTDRQNQGIFIGATGENVGKTTTSLGIYALLSKRFDSVGFIKPVGQRTVLINNTSVDKDITLFKERFNIDASPEDMSPMTFTSGVSKKIIDQHILTSSLKTKITDAYDRISQKHSFTLVEGTGHVGVGSVASINNAQVASMLGLDMVLVAAGGIGSCLDSIHLNLALCKQHNVRVKGVIINKIKPEKQSMIEHYITRALEPHSIPVLGFLPFNPNLSLPTMRDFELLFKTSMISGEKSRFKSFSNPLLVSESRSTFLAQIGMHQLIITPACREDIAYAALEFSSCHPESNIGLILTGNQPLTPELKKALIDSSLPSLHAAYPSYDVMYKISNYNVKIRSHDHSKIDTAIHLIEDRIDLNQIF